MTGETTEHENDAALGVQIEPVVSVFEDDKTDSERLEFLIFNSAKVCHSRDGDSCWVMYHEGENTVETLEQFDCARDAIDAAILGEVYEH